jgi:mannose-1-phosphate guanylyltransferase
MPTKEFQTPLRVRIVPSLVHDGEAGDQFLRFLCHTREVVTAALILSAGLGTRLAPLSSWRAKPLVPIGDRPAIDHIVARLRGDCAPLVVNAFHRADEVAAYARGAGLAVSREESLLGTAGGLARAGGLLGSGDVLVWNGDMVGDLDVAALLDAHAHAHAHNARSAAGRALATLVVRARSDAAGNTGLDAHGDVVRIRRDPSRDGEARSADFMGVYVVSAELRRRLPPQGDVIAEAFLPALGEGGRIASFATDAEFIDVGTPGAYLEANLRWLASRGLRAWTGDGAQVDPGVELDRVIVGAGARLVGAGKMEACVVWPGAEAYAPATRAIVAPDGIVSVAV